MCTVQAESLKHAELLDHSEHKVGLVANKAYASESVSLDGLSLEIRAVSLLLQTLLASQVCARMGG